VADAAPVARGPRPSGEKKPAAAAAKPSPVVASRVRPAEPTSTPPRARHVEVAAKALVRPAASTAKPKAAGASRKGIDEEFGF
jgi:hypothetical protein